MNFLSHYYFERENPNENIVMGVVLPDFVKNAHKEWNLHPQKEEALFYADPVHHALLKGWKRHLETDRIFHNSGFFTAQTAVLKQMILPAVAAGPVKPFFLAHIALELILDHLLVLEGKINVQNFYEQLQQANTPSLRAFLTHAKLPDIELFYRFLNNFISSRYLLSYQKIENITYALNRICMRLWEKPFTDTQLEILTKKLESYKETITLSYHDIFTEIEISLNKMPL
jgi:acyl carrier protein phosphodiesterase